MTTSPVIPSKSVIPSDSVIPSEVEGPVLAVPAALSLGPAGILAVQRCSDLYRAYELPPAIRRLGLQRLLGGLNRYGPDAYVHLSEREWLVEALEELLDAFNMLGGMRDARGEPAFALTHLCCLIRQVRDRLQSLRTEGPPAVPPPHPASVPPLRPGEGAGGEAPSAAVSAVPPLPVGEGAGGEADS